MASRVTCSLDMPVTFTMTTFELPAPARDSCESCRYWLKFKGEDAGECRRMPPFDGGFPSTEPAIWCGEWKGREVKE
jgi:hypothetical protein